MPRHTKKTKLEKALLAYQKNKQKVLADVSQIESSFLNGKISENKKEVLLANYLKGQSVDYWLSVYDYYIKVTEKQLGQYKLHVSFYQEASIIGIIFVMIAALFSINGDLTGFAVNHGTNLANQTGFWFVENGAGYNGDAYISNVAGSELHYLVSGRQIQLLTQRRNDCGVLQAMIDGQMQLLDLYS